MHDGDVMRAGPLRAGRSCWTSRDGVVRIRRSRLAGASRADQMSARIRVFTIGMLASLGALAACTTNAGPSAEQTSVATAAVLAAPVARSKPRGFAAPRRPDGSPIVIPRTEQPKTAAPAQELLYFGGRVISNVKVYAISWGSSVSSALTTALSGFYTAITDSAYFDWLSEYDTIGIRAVDGQLGSNQRIGRGTFGGAITITPSNLSSLLTDNDIASELAAQIAAGHLPEPETDAAGNVNSLYMFDFPSYITVSVGIIGPGCVKWGAYHNTTEIGGKSVPYGVHPDCGYPVRFVTAIHSHELIESVTDAEAGLTGDYGRPLAWYGYQGGADIGEIGDICEAIPSPDMTVAGYTVQKVWSNSQGSCIGTSPTIICDGATPPIAGCRACTAADDGLACNGVRPHCEVDPTSSKVGQCVACTGSAQCAVPNAVCNNSADALDDTCVTGVACATTADCAIPSPICDATSHKCRACSSADCNGATTVCESLGPNAGQCVQCTKGSAGACTGAKHACDDISNTCVACIQDTDCPSATPLCTLPPTVDAGGYTEGLEICAACATNLDCLVGVCATSPADSRKGRCVGCVTSSDCPGGGACDTTTDQCFACLTNANCLDPTPVCGAERFCVGCQMNGDCAMSTQGPACALSGSLAGSCVQCNATSDCKTSGATCNTTTHNCEDPIPDAGSVDANVDLDAGGGDGAGVVSDAAAAGSEPLEAGPVQRHDAGHDAGGAKDGGDAGAAAGGGESRGCAITRAPGQDLGRETAIVTGFVLFAAARRRRTA